MKKLLAMLSELVFLFSGCQDSSAPDSVSEPEKTSNIEQTTKTDVQIGQISTDKHQIAVIGKLTLSVRIS